MDAGGLGRARSGQQLPRVAGRGGVPPSLGISNISPATVVYLSCGEESGSGEVYQVDDSGCVLGVVKLPYLATGLALQGSRALIAVSPRDGGRIYGIDDTGTVSVVLEKQSELLHPVDVAVGVGSDSIIVADNVSHLLATTSTAGRRPTVYYRFPGPTWDLGKMSLALTRDKHVLFSGDGEQGVLRFSGDQRADRHARVLPAAGGVAGDTASARWAATQPPDQILVFEGERVVERLPLPMNQRFYGPGLMSFGLAGSIVVAVREADDPQSAPRLVSFDIEKKQDRLGNTIRDLFRWERAKLADFVIGPRMFWDRKPPTTYRSIY